MVQKLEDPFAFRVANENYLMKNSVYLFHLDLDLDFPCNIGYNVNINPALPDQLGVRTNLKAQMSKCGIYLYIYLYISSYLIFTLFEACFGYVTFERGVKNSTCFNQWQISDPPHAERSFSDWDNVCGLWKRFKARSLPDRHNSSSSSTTAKSNAALLDQHVNLFVPKGAPKKL